MLSANTIQRVKAAADIRQVFEHYGFSLSKRVGKDYLVRCPFHDDREPSMHVTPAKNNCKCYVCGGRPMDAIAFVMKYRSLNFPAAIRELAGISHIFIDEAEAAEIRRSRTEPQQHQPQPQPQPAPKIEAPPTFTDPAIMRRTFGRLSENPLFAFCSRLFGEAAAREAFALYNVGTARYKVNPLQGSARSVVFWQVDEGGRVRGGKIMPYDPATGKRIKYVENKKPRDVTWAHSAMKMEGYTLRQCLFGQHLLAQPSERVNIVESEKTAILARLYFGEALGPWVATGGKGNEGHIVAALPLLEGRRVHIYPDSDALEKWSALAEEVGRLGVRVEVSTALSGESAAAKLDLGDIIVAHMESKARASRDEAEEQPATASASIPINPTEAAGSDPRALGETEAEAERNNGEMLRQALFAADILKGIYKDSAPTIGQIEILDPAKDPGPCPF